MEILGNSLKGTRSTKNLSVQCIRFYQSGIIYMSGTLYKSLGLKEGQGLIFLLKGKDIYLVVCKHSEAMLFKNKKGSYIITSAVIARKVISFYKQEMEKMIWVSLNKNSSHIDLNDGEIYSSFKLKLEN